MLTTAIYDQSFAFSGTVIALSGLRLFPLPWLQRNLKMKKAEAAKSIIIHTQEPSMKT